ncbi:YHYH protein [Flavobacteriaceae bacterium GF1]
MNINKIAIVLIFCCMGQMMCAHAGGHGSELRNWNIVGEQASVFQASFLLYKNNTVFFEDRNGEILKYPLSALAFEDQNYILERHNGIASLNLQNRSEKLFGYKRNLPFYLSIALGILLSICLMVWPKKSRSFKILLHAVALLFVSSVFVTCSEDKNIGNLNDFPSVPANDMENMGSHFGKFTGVATSFDDTYFYVSSPGFPEHNMMEGITAWNRQVPVPQDYSGDNSWAIPIQPVLADEPFSLREHFMKGAIAIAVNGIPIFNPLNNRGEDTKLIGELDEWGGHAGRADDYHYHIPPVHLEATVGANNPIAYALDGFPIYGKTTDELDEFFGKFNDDGSYQYHSIDDYPYFIPKMRGKVSLDPNTTAPEDQIWPQALSIPLRQVSAPSLSNGSISFGPTGTNAYTLAYQDENGNDIATINYDWDNTGLYTFQYVAADGTGTIETYQGFAWQGEGSGTSDFTLSSVAIDENGELLDDYKCEEKVNGSEASIPLAWSNVPEGVNSLVIIMHHYPFPDDTSEINSYLLLWGIDPSITEIPHGGADDGDWFMGANKDGNAISYTSPCSPGTGSHEYTITLYGLSETPPTLPQTNSVDVTYDVLIDAISSVTVIDKATLTFNDVN